MYTDTPYGFKENIEIISKYADKLRDATFRALEEEAILVVVLPVYHSREALIPTPRLRGEA